MYFEFMEYSVCEVLFQCQLSRTDVKELYSTYTACSVINAFSSYTAIMLNSVTIHAMRKSPLMPKPLKILLLSLAISDLGVGLLVQPFAIELLVKWTQRNNPSCIIYTSFTIILSLFSYASLFSVMIISADRFLAIHLHLRYQELVTYKSVVFVENLYLDFERISFLSFVVDTKQYIVLDCCSGRSCLSCKYKFFQLQDLFGCSSSHKSNSSSSTTDTRETRTWRKRGKFG